MKRVVLLQSNYLPWRGYLDLEQRKKELGLSEAKIIEYRWMVEEMRVSLFAQELKTRLPVSAKRLAEQLERARKAAGT